VDRLGIKRTWTLTWPYLDPDTYAYLDTIHLGLLATSAWLIDPQRTNRLPEPIASTGSAARSTDGFTATAGTLAWTSTALSGVPVAGGIAWAVPADGARLNATGRVPLIDGQTVTFSAHIAATRPVRLTVTTETATGTQVSTHDSDPVTPGAAGARTQLTLTPPATACRIAITVPPGTTSTVTTTAWQLEAGAAPTPWRPGGGAAVVLVDSLRVAYPVPGSYATTATLLEV
jgi:hypothetical protein